MKKKKSSFWGLIIAIVVVIGLLNPGSSTVSESEATSSTTVAARTDDFAPVAEIDTTQVTVTPTPELTPEVKDMTVHFLDVGQGLAIVAQSGDQTMVYDGGGRDASSYVVSYLQNAGVTSIDYLISSHYDEDHLAGLVGCLNALSIESVIGADYTQDSQIYTSFINAVTEKGLTIEHPAVGTKIPLGTGEFTILSPAEISADDNANSIAIKLENGEDSFIFTGDMDANGENTLKNSGVDLSCDILVLGHHGSAASTSNDFLQATVPAFAVLSCGADNQYGHPDLDTMEKLQSMDIDLYRTDKQGTLVAISNGSGITWSTEPCNDYSSGADSAEALRLLEEQAAAQTRALTPEATPEPTPEATPEPTAEPTPEATPEVTEAPTSTEEHVWLSETGSKHHNKPDCGRMNPNTARQVPRTHAESQGYDACKKCY